MPVSTKRGAFIVFEGCDKSGKTTQCKKLVEKLKEEGEKVEFCRFPERDTAIGSVIADYLGKKCELEDHAVHLLFAANRWEAVPKIKETLSAGTTLICDRYSFSGVAFTAAKQGLDLPWCRQPEVGLPEPDAVLYLTLSVEEAAKRAEFGGERYEETDFQKRVAANYSLLKEDHWKEIDASKSIDVLHTEIKGIVKDIMKTACDQELGQLWTNQSGDRTAMPTNGSGEGQNGTKTESKAEDKESLSEEPQAKKIRKETEGENANKDDVKV